MLSYLAQENVTGRWAPEAYGGSVRVPRYGQARAESMFAEPNPEYAKFLSLMDMYNIKPEPFETGTFLQYGGGPASLSILNALSQQAGAGGLAPAQVAGAMTPEQYRQRVIQNMYSYQDPAAFAASYYDPYGTGRSVLGGPALSASTPAFLQPDIQQYLMSQGVGLEGQIARPQYEGEGLVENEWVRRLRAAMPELFASQIPESD
jgi:hypothetical protein